MRPIDPAFPPGSRPRRGLPKAIVRIFSTDSTQDE
jgi:hypothetical protein